MEEQLYLNFAVAGEKRGSLVDFLIQNFEDRKRETETDRVSILLGEGR